MRKTRKPPTAVARARMIVTSVNNWVLNISKTCISIFLTTAAVNLSNLNSLQKYMHRIENCVWYSHCSNLKYG